MLSRRRPATHEDRFVERYARLLKFARQLTGSTAIGEDLVQDAFVNFTLTRPELDSIGNLDHYLFTTIRHLLLARVRRGPRREQSLVDFDSVVAVLTAVDEAPRRAAFVELSAICHYACVRRHTSRAGSVLILRFFHGYAPVEIARILGTTSRAVDDWVRLARREARLYRDDPGRLAFMSADPIVERRVVTFNPSVDFARTLREAVFQACTGRCEPPGRIEARLQASKPEPASTDTLAHLVSCASCLDRANTALGIARLADRFPNDTIGPAPRSGATGGPSPRANVTSHTGPRSGASGVERPSELQIAVNGFVVGSHYVSGASTELSMALPLHEPLGFIEVLDQAEERLLLLNVAAAPDGPAEQTATALFDGGRRLRVRVRFDRQWPVVEVAYCDPDASDRPCDVELFDQATADGAPAPRARGNLRLVGGALIGGVLRATRAAAEWTAAHLPGVRTLRTLGVPAAIACGVILAPSVVDRDADRLSAAMLLRESAAHESQATARRDVATHRVFDVEQRRLPGGSVISKRRLDVWTSSRRDIRARRLYADGDRLIGTRRSPLDSPPPPLDGVPDPAGDPSTDAWLIEPSARTFATLVPTGDVEVNTGAAAYRLHWKGASPRRGLIEAQLTIDGSTLRAVDQRLVVDHGNGRLFSYDFTETRFESLPIGQVAAGMFEAEPGAAGPRETRAHERSEASLRSVAPPGSASRRLGALEIDAWHALHTLGLQLGPDASVARSGGRVQVHVREPGILRQRVIAAAFDALGPSDRIDLDLAAPSRDPAAPLLGHATAVADAAGRDVLVGHFAALLTASPSSGAGQADELATQHAQWVLDQSSRLGALHASLQYFLDHSPAERIANVDLDHAATWQSLVRDHALSIGIHAERLLSQLEPMLRPVSAVPSQADREPGRASVSEDPLDELPMLSSFVREEYESALALFGAPPESTGAHVLAGRLLHALENIRRVSDAFSRPWRLGPRPDALDQPF